MSTVRIRKSVNTHVPASLEGGELAYTSNGDLLYIGDPTANAVTAIGGKRTPGILTANQALVANSTLGINEVRTANLHVLGGIYANASMGTDGQVLTSNGTVAYWNSAAPGGVTDVLGGAGLTASGGGAITLDVGAGNGIEVNATSVAVLANNGIVSNSTGVFVTGGLGLVSNSTGVHVGAANGITVDADAIRVTAGSGTVVNATGVHVLANSGIVSNATGIFVLANNGITANATGVYATGANGITITAAGINVLANSGILANSTGVFSVGANGITVTSAGINVLANSGILANSTGVFVTGANGISISAAGVNVLGSNAIVANSTGAHLLTGSTLTVNTLGVHVNSALSITDLTLSGNLTVTGTLTSIDATNLAVNDSIIELARNNGGDTLDIGFYGQYTSAGAKFTGLFRDQTDGVYKLFTGLTVEPSTTVDTSNTSFTKATLDAYLLSGGLVSNSTAVTLTANSTLNVNMTANSLTLTTPLVATSGGVGQSSYTAGDLLYASNTTFLSKLALGTTGKVLQSNGSAVVYDDVDGGTF